MSGIGENSGGDLYLPLTGAEILARLNGLGAAGASFADDVFRIKGSSDATKLAAFEVDGFTTATTRTFTLPNATGTVAILSLAQTFSATQTFAGIDATSIGATTPGTGVFTSVGIRDSGGNHTITLDTASDEAADRTLTIPAMAGNRTLALIDIAQTFTGEQTLAGGASSGSGISSGAIAFNVRSTTAAAGEGIVFTTTGDAEANIGAAARVFFSGTYQFTPQATSACGISMLGATVYLWGASGLVAGTPASLPLTQFALSTTMLTLGTDLDVNGTTASTSTTTGCATFAGGIGVAGAAYIGTTLNVASSIRCERSFESAGSLVSTGASKLSFDQLSTTTSRILAFGPNTSTAGIFDFRVASSDASINIQAISILSSGVASFPVAIRLGNAAVAATPVPTHTLTLQDSTGTTYRIPCVI